MRMYHLYRLYHLYQILLANPRTKYLEGLHQENLSQMHPLHHL